RRDAPTGVLRGTIANDILDDALDRVAKLNFGDQLAWLSSLGRAVFKVDGEGPAADVLSAALDLLKWHTNDFRHPGSRRHWAVRQRLVEGVVLRRSPRARQEARSLERDIQLLPEIEYGYR